MVKQLSSFSFYHQRMYPEKVYCIGLALFLKEQIKASSSSSSSSYTVITTNSQKKALYCIYYIKSIYLNPKPLLYKV